MVVMNQDNTSIDPRVLANKPLAPAPDLSVGPGTALFGTLTVAADNTASSLFGTDKNAVLNAVSSPGSTFNQTVREHRAGFDFASGIGAMVAVAVATDGLSAFAGGALGAALDSTAVGRNVARFAMSEEKLASLTAQTAWKGSFRGLDEAALEGYKAASLGRKARTVGQLTSSMKKAAWLRGAGKGAVFEATLFATQRKNEQLYVPGELATNMTLAAIGIAVPAVLGWLVTNKEVNMILSNPEMNQVAQDALDVTGALKSRETQAKNLMNTEGNDFLGGNSNLTTVATSELVQADSQRAAMRGGDTIPQQRTALNNAANASDELALSLVNRVTVQGIPGTTDSAFPLTGLNAGIAGETMKGLMKSDPTFVLGVEAVGKIPEGRTVFEMKQAYIESLRTTQRALEKLAKEPNASADIPAAIRKVSHDLNNSTYHVVFNGEKIPIEQFSETKFATNLIARQSAKESSVILVDNSSVRLQKDGAIFIGGNRDINKLEPRKIKDFQTVQAIYTGLEHMAQIVAKDEKGRFFVPKQANRFQLDYAERLIELSGEHKVVFPKGMTRDSARMESLAQKYTASRAANPLLPEAARAVDLTAADRYFYNLPRIRSAEQGITGKQSTFIDHYFASAGSADAIRNASYAELTQAAGEFRANSTLLKQAKRDIKLTGDSMAAGKTFEGRQAQPLMVIQRNPDPVNFSREGVETQMAREQTTTIQQILGDSLKPAEAGTVGAEPSLVQKLMGMVVTHPGYQKAVELGTLAEIGFPSRFVQSWALRETLISDHPTLQAAATIQDGVERFTKAAFREIYTASGLEETMAQLRVKRSSSQLLKQTLSARRNFGEVKADLVPAPGHPGLFSIQLENNATNQQRWKALYGTDMPEGAVIPISNGKPAVFDALGADYLKQSAGILDTHLAEGNKLRIAKGLRASNHINHYLVPVAFTAKPASFLIDMNTNTVLQAVTGGTEKAIAEHIASLAKNPESLLNRPGVEVMSQAQIEKFKTNWSAQMPEGFRDPGLTTVNVGQKKFGSSASTTVEDNILEEQVFGMQRMFHQLGQDSMDIAFEPQLIAAKLKSNFFPKGTAGLPGKSAALSGESIQDFYVRLIQGRSAISSTRSQGGKLIKTFESTVDSGLAALQEKLNRFGANPFGKTAQAKREYKQLTEEIGQHMPFSSVDEYLVSKFGGKKVLTSKVIINKLNFLTASVLLRWGETSQAIMNGAGLVANLPAMIQTSLPRVGESAEAFKTRVGIFGDIYHTNGEPIAVPSMTKILYRAGRRMAAHADPEAEAYRIKMGYNDQQVAEFNKSWNNLTRKNDWTRFIHKADEYLSMLTDKSEGWTRQYAHGVGVEIAHTVGIDTMIERESWAHGFANKIIADYNSKTKPKIFQGSYGSIFGMFQSFSNQWFTNMFRFLEDGQYKTAAIAYGMQFGLFGLTSVPGYQGLESVMNISSDGQDGLYQRVYDAFGQQAGDLLTAGTLANVPVAFGGPASGINSRGDMNPRQLSSFTNPPIVTIAKNLFKSVGQGIDLFREGNPSVTMPQVARVLGVALSNRPLQGMLQVMAGESTDNQGNLISKIHLNSMEAVYKLMGSQTLREQKIKEAMWKNKEQARYSGAVTQRLFANGRALVRAGKLNELPKILSAYVANGGNPANIKTVLKQLIATANVPKQQQQIIQLMNAMHSNQQVIQLQRLLDATPTR